MLSNINFTSRIEADKFNDKEIMLNKSTFAGCNSLRTLYIPHNAILDSTVFSFCSNLEKIHFIGESLADVKNKSGYPWKANKSIITADYP